MEAINESKIICSEIATCDLVVRTVGVSMVSTASGYYRGQHSEGRLAQLLHQPEILIRMQFCPDTKFILAQAQAQARAQACCGTWACRGTLGNFGRKATFLILYQLSVAGRGQDFGLAHSDRAGRDEDTGIRKKYGCYGNRKQCEIQSNFQQSLNK